MMPQIIDIIDKKRQGQPNTEAEIRWLVSGAVSESIPDYQIAAWLMAVCLQGLNLDETTWLTDAYVHSGEVLDLSMVSDIVADKHSTGGVGDKTTLVLVPLLAAAGVPVAKLSGRGLGFSGGTIDKLEAIPSFQVSLTNEAFVSQLKEIGMAISSQTSGLAPADGKIYALRDVTATVESIPLIAASVVSKKIAAGASVIVLDIKAGRGAFMKTIEQARELAFTCREIGKRLGKTISTVISRMDEPLGYAVGNSLEVIESIQTLQGQGPVDLERLCLKLGAVALLGTGKYGLIEKAESVLADLLQNGQALQKFKDLIRAQGGNDKVVEDFSLLSQAKSILPVISPVSGYITNLDSLGIAGAAKVLGAGRAVKGDAIDPAVGVLLKKKAGGWVQQNEVWAELYVGNKDWQAAMDLMKGAITLSQSPSPLPSLIDEITFG